MRRHGRKLDALPKFRGLTFEFMHSTLPTSYGGVFLSVFRGPQSIAELTVTRCNAAGYAAIDEGWITEAWQGKGLYPVMLTKMRDHVKAQGCKGLVSRVIGRRGKKSTASWEKFAAREPRVRAVETQYGPDYYLDGLGKMLDPAEGYRIQVKREGAGVYSARALSPSGAVVGEVGFGPASINPDVLEAGEVFVEPGHRRKGIATAMYADVEKVSRRKVIPSWVQSDEGRALWAGSGGRHFGGLPARGRIPLDTVKRARSKLPKSRRSCGFTTAELREGMEIEREHRDVTGGRVGTTARIAATHLCERRDYYKRLKKFVEG